MIEHVKDFRRIKRVYGWDVCISPECYYLMEVKNGKDLGGWFFHPCDDGLMIHARLNDECRGKTAANSAKEALKWIFSNTVFNVVYADIPPERRNACLLAVVVGFDFVGCTDTNRCYEFNRDKVA